MLLARKVQQQDLFLLVALQLCCRQFFFQQLPFIQSCILTPVRQQFIMRSLLDDSSFVQNKNQVGLSHGRDSMRHDDTGALAHDTAKLSCELFTTRRVPTADADCAAPRARINDGSAIVASVQITDAVNSRSISVKPASPFTEPTL